MGTLKYVELIVVVQEVIKAGLVLVFFIKSFGKKIKNNKFNG